MILTTQNRLALFVDNAQKMKKEFSLNNATTKRLSGFLYALENKQVDCGAIRKCRALINENTGLFSAFRGNMLFGIATMLSLTTEPNRVLVDTLEIYNLLRNEKFRASDHLVIAAFEIALQADSSDYEKVVGRTYAFYDELKVKRFFPIGQDDYIYSAMLGLSVLAVTTGVKRVEQTYLQLANEFSNEKISKYYLRCLFWAKRMMILLNVFYHCDVR